MSTDLVTHVEFHRSLDDALRPPSADDVEDAWAPRVPWPARITSIVHGLGFGAAAVCGILLLALVPDDTSAVAGWGLAAGILVVTVLPMLDRRTDLGLLEYRTTFAVAAIVVVAVALTPPAALAHGGGRFLLVVVAGLFGGLAWLVRRQLRTAMREATRWNGAFGSLVEDPRRADTVSLGIDGKSHGGRGKLVTGTVQYGDDAGRVRTVALSTLTAFSFFLAESDRVDSTSACVVWHTPDHSVVLTRIVIH